MSSNNWPSIFSICNVRILLVGVSLCLIGFLPIADAAKNPKGKSDKATHPPSVSAVANKTGKEQRGSDKTELRIRNNTPFIVQIFVAGIRVGWIKPFRVERFRGLNEGYHKIFAHSEYGTASWGPKNLWVPGVWNLKIDPESQSEDMAIALSSKIFRANKSSLLACDKLAERRGETLQDSRAEFEVKVNDQGVGEVSVTGEKLSPKLLSCYRMVVKQWTFPEIGSAYTVSLQHVH